MPPGHLTLLEPALQRHEGGGSHYCQCQAVTATAMNSGHVPARRPAWQLPQSAAPAASVQHAVAHCQLCCCSRACEERTALVADHLGEEDAAMSRFLHVPGRPAPAAAQPQAASHPPRGKKYAAGTSKNPVMLATVQVVIVCRLEVPVKLPAYGCMILARSCREVRPLNLGSSTLTLQAWADSAFGQSSRTS